MLTQPACSPAVAQMMRDAGYRPTHTGDSWERVLPDDSGWIWITTEGNRIDGDPAAAEWICSRYGSDESFVEVTDALPLPEAIRIGGLLHAPVQPWQDTQLVLSAAAAEAWDIAVRWTQTLGLGWHPDTRGQDYVQGEPPVRCFSDDEAAAYDADMARLCALASDPYEVSLLAMHTSGLYIEPAQEG